MTSDYHHITEHGPNKQLSWSLIDWSFTYTQYSACEWLPESSRNKLVPDWPASVTWGSHVNTTTNLRICLGLNLIERPGCLLPGLAITNKNFQKAVFTATRHRGPMGFLTVRQLGKLCANGAILWPVSNTPNLFYLFSLGNWVINFFLFKDKMG